MVSTNLIFISIIVLGIIYLYINSRQYLVREGFAQIGDKIGNCVKEIYSGTMRDAYVGWCDPKCKKDAGYFNSNSGKYYGKKAWHCWDGKRPRYVSDDAKYCQAARKECGKLWNR